MEDRGAGSEIGTFTGDQYEGRFTGNVIDLCPVGALTSIPYRFVARPWDITNTPSVCGHDADRHQRGADRPRGHVARVTGRPDAELRGGGGLALRPVALRVHRRRAPDRLRHAVIRDAGRVRDVEPGGGRRRGGAGAAPRRARSGCWSGPTATVEEGFLAQELAAGAAARRDRRSAWASRATASARSAPCRPPQLADIDAADLVRDRGRRPGQPAARSSSCGCARRAARGARVVSVGAAPARARGARHRRPRARRATCARRSRGRAARGRAVVVLWDEADLAAEPDAADALAPPRRRPRRARRSSWAPTSTAPACARSACPPRACSRRRRPARSTSC